MKPASLPTDIARPAARPALGAPAAPPPRHAALAVRPRSTTSPALLLLALAAPGCRAADASIGLSKGETRNEGALDVPVPAENGPKLVALRAGTPIFDRPDGGARSIGELSFGAVVARSVEPHGRKGCHGGWYAIRPRGFVCISEGATLRAEVTDILPGLPDRTRPLPYRYGRAKTQGAPAYHGIPGREELQQAEPDLDRHLDRAQHHAAVLGSAANDVPLDERGVAVGPPVLLPTGEGVGEGAQRTEATYFTFPSGDALAPLLPLSALGIELGNKDTARADLRSALKTTALRKGSGVAISRSVTTGDVESRRFGITPDGRLIPLDRLQPALGSTWHGIDVEKIGLPVAFVHRFDVHTWSLGRGKATPNEEEIERHAAVPLTGRFRTVDGIRFEESRDGFWLRAQDLVVIVRRSKLPDFAKGAQRWLDVSLANQTLTAYEGPKPIYATLISSGRDQLRDPATSASTARGTFRIRSKHVTRGIDPREVGEGFDIADAPWVMEFEPGYSITGMYWSDRVGEAHGFHDITLTPIDARRLWMWTEPEVPEGWHAVYSAEGEGTLVNVRP